MLEIAKGLLVAVVHTYLIFHFTTTHKRVGTSTKEFDEHIASLQVPMSNVDVMEILKRFKDLREYRIVTHCASSIIQLCTYLLLEEH